MPGALNGADGRARDPRRRGGGAAGAVCDDRDDGGGAAEPGRVIAARVPALVPTHSPARALHPRAAGCGPGCAVRRRAAPTAGDGGGRRGWRGAAAVAAGRVVGVDPWVAPAGRAREWRGQHGRRAARASTRAAAARARARPRLHAEELDNVLAVKPRERRHLLASGAHHRDRRYLHGDVCSERAEGRSTRAGGARLRVRLVACGAARTCERLDVLCDAHGAVRAGAEQAEVGPVDAVLPVRRERVGGRRRRR